MKPGAWLFAVAAVVGGLAGIGVVRAVEGSVRPLHAAAGWLVACASAGLARWINSRSLRRAAARPAQPRPRNIPPSIS
jgi:hypothetical protein